MKLIAYICGIIAAVIWGGNMTIIRMGITQTPLAANDLTAIRFAVCGLILLPVILSRGISVGPWGWKGGIVLATGAGIPYMLLTAVALSYVPASHSAISPGVVPIFTALLVWWTSKQVPTVRYKTGAIFAFLGAIMLAQIHSFTLSDSQNFSHFLLILAALTWAIYTIANKAWSVEPIHSVACVSVLSAIVYLPYYFVSGNGSNILAASWFDIIVQVVCQGVLVSIVALLAYTHAIKILGPGKAALFPSIFPIVTTVSAVFIVQEIPSILELVGILFITVGLYVAFNVTLFPKNENEKNNIEELCGESRR